MEKFKNELNKLTIVILIVGGLIGILGSTLGLIVAEKLNSTPEWRGRYYESHLDEIQQEALEFSENFLGAMGLWH